MEARKFGTVSHSTGRLIFRPAPTFTIEQYRRKDERERKKQLKKTALGDEYKDYATSLRRQQNARGSRSKRVCRDPPTTPKSSPLLKSSTDHMFNAAVDIHPNTDISRHHRHNERARDHARKCPELKTVISKFREGYYDVSKTSLEQHVYNDKPAKKAEPYFPEATSWFKGMWVECNFENQGVWRPCQISRIQVGQEGLLFDLRYPLMGGGFRGVECNVPEKRLRWCPPRRHWHKGEAVVVNWNGRGTWYTASIVHVHEDGSNSVDIKFDDGRTVGCVHGPRYVTRVPSQHIQQIQWYVGQPVLAQFRGRGLWYRAHVTAVTTNLKYNRFAGTNKDSEPKELVDVKYDGLGGGEAKETGITNAHLRPWLGTFENLPNMSMPVLEADNFGSSIDSIFVPSTAEPGSLNVAWFWGNTVSSQPVLKEKEKNEGAQAFEHPKNKMENRPGLNSENTFARIRDPHLLEPRYDRYSLDGHVRTQFQHNLKRRNGTKSQTSKRPSSALTLKNRKLRDMPKKTKAGRRHLSSDAIKSISGPDALVGAERRGPGLERVTVRMAHKDLGTIGLTLQKFTDAIDHVGYRSGGKQIAFYVTVRPGSYEDMSKAVSKISGGTASVSLATQEEIDTKFSSGKRGFKPDPKSVKALLTDSRSVSTKPTHSEMINYLNNARRGNIREVSAFLSKFPESVSLSHPISGTNAILAATRGGHFKTAHFLIKKGADPNAKDKSGRSALEEAYLRSASSARFDPRFLGMLKSDVTLHTAAATGDLQRLKYIVTMEAKKEWSRGERINAKFDWSGAMRSVTESKNKYGMTALHLAVMNGHVDAARFLSKLGDARQWRQVNNVGQTPHDLARCVEGKEDDLLAIAEASRHHTVTLVPLFEGKRIKWKGGKSLLR